MRLFAATLLAVVTVTLTVRPGRAETIRLGDRFHVIDLPANPKGAPLILALHGGGGGPKQFASSSSGRGPVAVRQGYTVIFPAGTGRRGEDRLLTWNGGYCCGDAARRGVDDEGFLAELIRDAVARFGLGAYRVYLTGMSNGSIMVETFAARNPDLIRAVAGVAGTMDSTRVRVQGRVPALIIHGAVDGNVPYEGGDGPDGPSRTDLASTLSVVDAFLAPWGGVLSITDRRIDRRDDGTAVVVTDYRKGSTAALRLMTVEGGDHHWPGSHKARLRTGKTQEIDANTGILRFFALHP